jgi:uncharacterized phage protein gp47/JayE
MAEQRGVFPEQATKAIRQGEFYTTGDGAWDVPIGSRWTLNGLTYVAMTRESMGIYRLECESAGDAGNQDSGALVPVEYVAGLEKALLTAIMTPGQDEESTESIRSRYKASFKGEGFGGNIADYVNKVNLVPGVGGVKVIPIWAGPGTVKIVFIDSAFNVPSPTLVDDVQLHEWRLNNGI